MRSGPRQLHLLIVAIVLQGCMIGPDYKRPDSSSVVPSEFAFNSNTSDTQDEMETSISSTWWELYQDPVLNNLVAKALENNADIKLAVARVEEADAYLQEVGAALFPTIDFKSNATRSRISEVSVLHRRWQHTTREIPFIYHFPV